MAFTKEQERWFTGFWMFFQGQPRPIVAGPMRAGWDAAQKSAKSSGGY